MIAEENPGPRWTLGKPLDGLSTSCKQWYIAIRVPLVRDLGGKATSIDKSVFCWADSDFNYNCGKDPGGKCFGCKENAIYEVGEIVGWPEITTVGHNWRSRESSPARAPRGGVRLNHSRLKSAKSMIGQSGGESNS